MINLFFLFQFDFVSYTIHGLQYKLEANVVMEKCFVVFKLESNENFRPTFSRYLMTITSIEMIHKEKKMCGY